MRETAASLRERPPRAARASRTAHPSAVRGLGLALAAAAFLAFSGAFGMAAVPLSVRLGYWAVTMTAGATVGALVAWLFARGGWLETPPWVAIPALTLAMTAPITVVVWALSGWFFGVAPQVVALPGFALTVLVITSVMTSLNVLVGRTPVTTHASPTPTPPVASHPVPQPVPSIRFLERLPSKLKGADLFAVEAEDHYLRLHTSRGSDLILFRLADAMAELEGIEGAQTHRSWWVARGAVLGATRSDGRATLSLPGGVEAPVSRTYARALKEAGWF